jgi:hypothetical protein
MTKYRKSSIYGQHLLSRLRSDKVTFKKEDLCDSLFSIFFLNNSLFYLFIYSIMTKPRLT